MIKEKKLFAAVSVLIPTRNRYQDLKACLASLKEQTYPQEKISIVVIDNNSIDQTKKMVSHLGLKIIHLKTNLGFAKALNLGAKKIKTKYLLVTNDDVVFAKNYLVKLVTLMEQKPKVAITHGKMYFKNSYQPATPGYRLIPFLGYHPRKYTNLNQAQECEIATGGNMLIRKIVFDQTKGFDPGYFWCGEDYDFCLQVRRLGWKIYYEPQAVCWHGFLQSRQEKTFTSQALFAHYQAKFRYLIKNAKAWQILVFLPCQFIGWPIIAFLRGGTSLALYPPMFKALFWNLKHLKSTLIVRHRKWKIESRW